MFRLNLFVVISHSASVSEVTLPDPNFNTTTRFSKVGMVPHSSASYTQYGPKMKGVVTAGPYAAICYRTVRGV